MKLSYYPGCSLSGTARDYDSSIRRVCRSLGIELQELADWNCCGASSAHMTDPDLADELATRNLELARDERRDLVTPCAACFQRLSLASKHDESAVGIHHLTRLLSCGDVLRRIEESVVRPLTGLRVACYYGCLALRPPALTGETDHEHPAALDTIVDRLGAEPVRWSHATECCGGALTVARPDISEALVDEIAGAAARAGAMALVTDCPMCQANVDSRQSDLPTFFATELIEVALGGEPERRWKDHLVNPLDLLRQLDLQ